MTTAKPHTHTHTHIYIYVCVCVCVCVCLCVCEVFFSVIVNNTQLCLVLMEELMFFVDLTIDLNLKTKKKKKEILSPKKPPKHQNKCSF